MTRVYASLLAAALVFCGCSPGGGGCPWTEASEVEVRPATSCLDVSVADASGEGESSGCVNPVLVIENRCDTTLRLPGPLDGAADEAVVAPGGRLAHQVSLERGEAKARDRYGFELRAILAETALSIEFETWRD